MRRLNLRLSSNVFLALCQMVLGDVQPGNNSFAMVNDWESITPSPILEWIPCFQSFACARLEVPLDYGDPTRGTTAIAFVKLAAINATEHTRNVVINPGGPGGSGVDTILNNGIPFASVIQAGHNVIGFDPRGVGHSGPVVDCWPNSPESRAQFERLFYSDTSYASSTSLSEQFYSAEFFGKACTSTIGGQNGSAAFVSAPAVARDLLAYIKAEQAAAGKPEHEAKLSYYGISYGTLLGTTFAHLFPEHVGPMIMDGVLDVEDVYQLGWRHNLYDADKAIDSFYEFCYQAGDNGCPFWASSPRKIAQRLTRLLDRLKYNPIPVSSSDSCPIPLLATYSGLKELALQTTLFPLIGFPALATVLAGIENGDATAYMGAVTTFLAANPCNNGTRGTTQDNSVVIKCVDGFRGSKLDVLEKYERYVADQVRQSKFFGEVWPNNANTVLCRSFDVEPPQKGRLDGSILERRQTATPILFVSAEIDPLTPKRGAYKMSSVFKDSEVLIQASVGHTAIASVSSCLIEVAQNYYTYGELPHRGLVCQPDLVPFQASLSASEK